MDEKIAHERTGHATYDPRCADVSRKCEDCQQTDAKQLRKLHTLTTQQSRTVNKVQKSRSWSLLDRAEKRLREPCIAKEQNSKILNCSVKVLQTRYGNIPEYCDQEECLREIARSTSGRLGLLTGVTTVKQSQANTDVQGNMYEHRENVCKSWLRTQDVEVLRSLWIILLHSGQCDMPHEPRTSL